MSKLNLFTDRYIQKGALVQLPIGLNEKTGRPVFIPIFLDSHQDANAPHGKKSVRIVRPAFKVAFPTVQVGEIWQARLAHIKLDSTKTVDGRVKLLFYFQDFKRIEWRKKVFNPKDRTGCYEVYSNSLLVDKKPVKLQARKEECLFGDHVTTVISYYEENNGLFSQISEIQSKKDFMNNLRQAGVDVSIYPFKSYKSKVANK